jgi:DNA topoisomerase-1
MAVYRADHAEGPRLAAISRTAAAMPVAGHGASVHHGRARECVILRLVPTRRSQAVKPATAPATSAADAPTAAPLTDDARAMARDARLRYATAERPGITRRRSGRGFTYRDVDGGTIRDVETLRRIRSLAIPPAWTDVWICPWPNGHLQATGRDARGRKQYRYHARWTKRRDLDKFDRMVAFARALPRLRRRVDADLARRGLAREKVLAAVVRLLELTLIRVGNDEYAKLNRSFGLTTLRDRHARVQGAQVRFRFRGKAGQVREVGLRDRRLAGIVRRCQELPGQELFQYVGEDGEVRDVASDDVNDYVRKAAGGDFTAKDFRTWAGTVLAYRALRALQPDDSTRGTRRIVVEAIKETAQHLGNTPAVARKSYVHPAVLEAYLDGAIPGALVEAAEEQASPPTAATPKEERAVVALLRQRLEEDAGR